MKNRLSLAQFVRLSVLSSILCCVLFFAVTPKVHAAGFTADLNVIPSPNTTGTVDQIIPYVITVENFGPDNATNVTLRVNAYSSGALYFDCSVMDDRGTPFSPIESLPPGPFHSSYTWECALSGLGVKNASGTTPITGRWIITLSLKGKLDPQDITVNMNVFSSSFDWIDPNMSNNQAQASVHIMASADLALAKLATPDPVHPGDTLTYTLNVTNNGPSTASNVLVKDWLPEGVSVNRINVTRGSYEAGVPGDPLRPAIWAVGALVGGLLTSANMTIDVTVLNSTDLSKTGWVLHNDASASSDTYDPDNSNNVASVDTAVVSTFVQERTDLSVMLFVKPDTMVLAGQLINYTIIVENLGPSYAYDIGIRDEIVSSGTFDVMGIYFDANRTSQSYTEYPRDLWGGRTIEFKLYNPLEPKNATFGGRWMVHITLRANETQDINSVVDVFSRTFRTLDSDLSNNEAEASIHVSAVADLKLTKTAAPTSLPYPNRALNYTLVVTNNGPSTATNVVVKDWLFEELSILNITYTKGACNFGVPGDVQRPVTWTVGSLAPGESATMLISTTLTTDTSQLKADVVIVRNDACVSSDTYDPDNSNNLASKLIFAGSSPTHTLPSSMDLSTMLLVALTTSISLASLMFAMRIKKIDPVSLVRKRLNFLKRTDKT